MGSATTASPFDNRRGNEATHVLFDLVVASSIFGFMVLQGENAEKLAGRLEPDALLYVPIVVAAVAMIWRRKAPIVVWSIVMSALAVLYWRNYGVYGAELGLPAAYAATRYGDNRRHVWVTVPLFTAALIGIGFTGIFDKGLEDSHAYTNALTATTYISGAALAGLLVRNRESIFSATEKRAEEAEANRLAEAQRAVAKERRRIAREMHDIVAHGMSVIAVQAGAAQQIVHTDPDKSAVVLERIEDTARESLVEMRRMLGVLRDEDDPADTLAPQPRLSEVTDVVEHAVAAGLPTELIIAGTQRDLAPGIELAAYRIVQEALTNVLKHGGKSATATVHLDYQPDSIVVEVSDDGRGVISKLSRVGGGNGLIGMQERVEVYGGQLDAGSVSGGGYSVRASLPLDPSSGATTTASEDKS